VQVGAGRGPSARPSLPVRRAARARKLLLCSRQRLDFWAKVEIRDYLASHPELREVYEAKEALHTFYRTRGSERAALAFKNLLKRLKASMLPELKALRRTLVRWRDEVLACFDTGVTNGRTEGYNAKAKLVKRCLTSTTLPHRRHLHRPIGSCFRVGLGSCRFGLLA